jgi:hypothetical protein
MIISQLLHDVSWSFHHGKLHELFFRDGITFATWGLVLVTGLLVWDGWRRGKHQENRWNREDAILAEARNPRYEFGLRWVTSRVDSVHMTRTLPARVNLWVANLGLHGLYVERLFIKHRDFGEASTPVEKIVQSGDQLDFEIPNSFWKSVPGISGSSDGVYLYGDHEVWLELADARDHLVTKKFLYTLEYCKVFWKLERGSNEERQATCPKCGQLLDLLLNPAGLLTEKAVQEKQWCYVLQELTVSCPNHESAHLHKGNLQGECRTSFMRQIIEGTC